MPGALFYEAARERILQYEAEQGRYGEKLIGEITLAFATFMDQIGTGKVPPPTNWSLWQTFLAYYKANTKRAYADKNRELRATYFARDTLLQAMARDKDKAFDAITVAFQKPARKVLARKYPNDTVTFTDVYQEALLGLFKNPPSPDKQHTAHLFSFFRAIMMNKAADAYRQGNNNGPIPDLNVNPTDDGNNINEFTDHIIEVNQLDNIFGSDDISEILSSAMGKLDEACRLILKSKYFDGLKHRDIAKKNGWSTDSVGTRVKRCLTKLKNILSGGKK